MLNFYFVFINSDKHIWYCKKLIIDLKNKKNLKICLKLEKFSANHLCVYIVREIKSEKTLESNRD